MDSITSRQTRGFIDRLTAIGCGKYIELPQIAVMGDTSTGKSSVLSAISGIDFPSNANLTTRCPTQLIMTRCKDASFTAKVKLQRYNGGKSGNEEECQILSSTSQISQAIADLTQKLVDEGQIISDDSIVIEAKGPELPDLTLTDLPGLVRAVKDGEDSSIIGRVRNLVHRYLSQKRTVVLAVLPANVDFHNSEILKLAQEADPEGERTVGIITKADLVDPGSEQQVIDLINNKVVQLKLGFHAVICRGQRGLSDGQTIQGGITREREFFETIKPWNAISRERVGIAMLKCTLSNLLQEMIQKNLPLVLGDIKNLRNSSEEKLFALGEHLGTSSKRRMYINGIFQSVRTLTKCGVSGSYDEGTDFFDKNIRLRSRIFELDTKFKKDIMGIRIKTPGEFNNGDQVEFREDGTWHKGIISVNFVRGGSGSVIVQSGKTTHRCEPQNIRHDITSIKKAITESRGDELVIFSSYSVFVKLFRETLSKWEPLALNHLRNYYKLSLEFLLQVLGYTIDNVKVRESFKFKVTQMLKSLLESAEEDLQKCIDTEDHPKTFNDELSKNFLNLRIQPVLQGLDRLPDNQISKVHIMDLLKLIGLDENLCDMQEYEACEMQIALASYTQLARRRFIDNIPLTLDNNFLRALVDLFDFDFSDAQLETLLAENSNVKARRESCIDAIKVLSEAESLIEEMMGF